MVSVGIKIDSRGILSGFWVAIGLAREDGARLVARSSVLTPVRTSRHNAYVRARGDTCGGRPALAPAANGARPGGGDVPLAIAPARFTRKCVAAHLRAAARQRARPRLTGGRERQGATQALCSRPSAPSSRASQCARLAGSRSLERGFSTP